MNAPDSFPTHWRSPGNLFALMMSGFILGQFCIASDKLWDFQFYISVLPSMLWLLWQHARNFRSVILSREMQLLWLLLSWLALSLIWQPDILLFDAFHWLRHALLTSLFILACLLLFYLLTAQQLRLFWHVAFAFVSIAGLISIALHLLATPEVAHRLEAIGQLEQPILGAAVYGVFGLVALYHAMAANSTPARLAYGAVWSIIALLVWLTLSRGQLIAFSLVSLSMVVSSLLHCRKRCLVMLLLLILMAVAILFFWHEIIDFFREENLLRKSYRLEIWSRALEDIAQRPLFGWGAASVFYFMLGELPISHMHNLFLGTLYYGGVLGGLLLAMLLLRCFLTQWHTSHPERLLHLCLLFYAVLSVLSDNPRLVSSPSPFWSIFWLPITYGLARHYRYHAQQRPIKEGNASC